MGILISRFRKEKSTLEVLEGLEKEIKSIEEFGHSTEQQHKAVVGRLLLFSVGLYVLMACLFYFFFFPAALYDQLLYIIPLLLFPIIILFLKRLVSWWYRRIISRNQEKLGLIKKQKKEILEEVMDKETYKIARQILEKFAPDQLRKGNAPNNTGQLVPAATGKVNKAGDTVTLTQRNAAVQIGTMGSEIRRRPLVTNPLSVERIPQRPITSYTSAPCLPPGGMASRGPLMTSEFTSGLVGKPPLISPIATDNNGGSKASVIVTSGASATMADIDDDHDADIEENDDNDEDKNKDTHDEKVETTDHSSNAGLVDDKGSKGTFSSEDGLPKGSPPSRLTRPILPRERTVMDRLVDYLVGDGVNQRYALICRNCNSHNGMALKEEFEYLAFQCCYCFHWNPARKQRLQAPRLESLPPSGNTTTSSSPAESNTDDEDDDLSPRNAEKIKSPLGVKETKIADRERKSSTDNSDGGFVANAGPNESPSVTDGEFESQVSDPSTIPPSGGGDAPAQ